MDIRNWPLDRIMQLPDWCFGRRWPISLQAVLSDANAVFDISKASLPERCVIWELAAYNVFTTATTIDFSLSLGDQLPASEAAFTACEPVFSGIRIATPRTSTVRVLNFAPYYIGNLRFPLEVAGRRFVARFIRVFGSSPYGMASIVVSSIPTEVPDWLISGPGRSQ